MKKESKSTPRGGDHTFKHRTTIGENGEILYQMPLEAETIHNPEDFGATPDQYRTLDLGGGDKIVVMYVPTTNRALAEYQWSYLTEEHNRRMRESRCMVKGKRGGYVICHNNNSCQRCPYGKRPEERERNTISWDALIEKGFEPEITTPVESQVLQKIEMEDVRARMEAKNPKIWEAFAMKYFLGDKVSTISKKLGVSPPRVYQLIDEAKAFFRRYRAED